VTRRIRRARPDEAAALRALAHRSKAHWPYSAEFLEKARPFLTLDARDVEDSQVWVLEVDGEIGGWHRVTQHGPRAELEDLWLEPAYIGGGMGRLLFEHAAALARREGAEHMDWDAEPYAEGFYRAMGGEEIGRTPSEVIAGRTLPRMRLDLRTKRQPETRNR
jgi:GNAT superfamily N-acetyltransferase